MAIEQEHIRPWERQQNESEEAFAAFDIYAKLGEKRSIAKTADVVPNRDGGLGKNHTLLEKWSAKYQWVTRAAAWDRYEARSLNEKLVMGRAEMRSRIITQAKNLQAHTAKRILEMTPSEIAQLPPRVAAQITKLAVDMEMKAREISAAELESGKGDFAPTFVIEFVPAKPPTMIQVRMPDGVTGFIPPESEARFFADNPEAVIIQREADAAAPSIPIEAAPKIEAVQ